MLMAIVIFCAVVAIIVGVVLGFDRPPQTRTAARWRNFLGIIACMGIVVGTIILYYVQATS